MILASILLLLSLSIWDYPARQMQHEQLRNQFVRAVREGDTETMIETCQKGVKLLPDDPTWRYNLACSLAYGSESGPALDALEKAIDLGFRDADMISKDQDLSRLAKEVRYQELIEYAKEMSLRPLTQGPNVCIPQAAITGGTVALGEQNFGWDFDNGLLVANLKLAPGDGGNAGDLYMNRDDGHSVLNIAEFPGLTLVKLDQDGHASRADLDMPNMLFPYPLFGNASRAFQDPQFWRSLPRMMLTRESWRMKSFQKLYLSNQFWVFPAHQDCPPVGKYGDVFASMCPYFMVTAGSSYTDLPYLRGALEASRSFRKETKSELVRRGLLTPMIQTLIRKSLHSVTNETDYFSAKAHPTAFAAGALDVGRLKRQAAALTKDAIPPLVPLSIMVAAPVDKPVWPEITYGSIFATAFVLRSADEVRRFRLAANGAEQYHFAVLRGQAATELTTVGGNSAELVIRRSKLSVTNRVDVAVFGRNRGTDWGAPSYVSFAVVDPSAPYSDPVLTPLGPVDIRTEKAAKK